MKNRWIVNVIVFGLLAAIIIYLLIPSHEPAPADPGKAEPNAPSTQAITVDRATLEKMVHDEVEKQLATAVSEEMTRQIAGRQPNQNVDARKNSIQSTLQTIRSQLELYRIQHNDQPPALADMTNWAALTSKTDTKGNIGPTNPYGPYILNPVANPFTGKTKVAPTGQADADAGWTYNEKTAAFRAVLPAADARRAGLTEADVEATK